MNMDDQLIEDIRTLLQALLPETQRDIIEPQIKAMNKGSKEARLEARLMVIGGLIWASMCGCQSAQQSDHIKANDALEDALRLTGWDAELS
jgi:uncharacterized BrkB/YihY/UPF0761 family membrane protein